MFMNPTTINMFKKTLCILLLAAMIIGCGNDYMPKPDGYLRIDLPVKSYVMFDTVFPYSFEHPSYAKVFEVKNTEQPFWSNIEISRFSATIYLSYKPVKNNLDTYIEDTRMYVMKHIPKASSIDELSIVVPGSHVSGIIYDIKGSEAASPCQFYLTDSSRHFLRGALYFNNKPDNDSLATVIEFLKADIQHLAETLKWKN